MDSQRAESIRRVIESVWIHFKKSGGWPSRKALVIELDARGENLDDVLGSGHGVHSSRHSQKELITASCDALIEEVPEARSLLEPLPKILELLIAQLVANHPFMGEGPRPCIRFREIVGLWPDPDSAKLAIGLVNETSWGPIRFGASTGPLIEDRFESAEVSHLRYDGATTLEDVIEIKSRPKRVEVGRFPSGKPLETIRLIYQHAVQHHEWPEGLRFAVLNRKIGYMPDILHALASRYIRDSYGERRGQRLKLKPVAAHSADSSGELTGVLLEVARALAELWIVHDDGTSLEQLSAYMKVSAEALAPAVLFFESEPWGYASFPDHDPQHPWRFRANEKVLQNRRIKTWDEFLDHWYPESASWPYSGSASGSEPITPAALDLSGVDFSFVKNERLRSVLTTDLDELRNCIQVGAWKGALILSGSITEAVLIDILDRRADVVGSMLKSKRRWPDDAGLTELIGLACQLDLVQASVVPFAEVARNYRNLIHPVRSAESRLRANRTTVRAVLHCLEVVTADLREAHADGRLHRFETS